jgi:hypothetical protein
MGVHASTISRHSSTYRVEKRAINGIDDTLVKSRGQICEWLDIGHGNLVYPLQSADPHAVDYASGELLTRTKIHSAAGDGQKKPDGLVLVAIILWSTTWAGATAYTGLPDFCFMAEHRLSGLVLLTRKTEASEEKKVENEINEGLSQRRPNLFVVILWSIFSTWIQAVEDSAWLILLCIPEILRLARFPEKPIVPGIQMFGFVNKGQEPGQDADAIHDFTIRSEGVSGIQQCGLELLHVGHSIINQGLEILHGRGLLSRVWLVCRICGRGTGEDSDVSRDPNVEDIVDALRNAPEL